MVNCAALCVFISRTVWVNFFHNVSSSVNCQDKKDPHPNIVAKRVFADSRVRLGTRTPVDNVPNMSGVDTSRVKPQ